MLQTLNTLINQMAIQFDNQNTQIQQMLRVYPQSLENQGVIFDQQQRTIINPKGTSKPRTRIQNK